MNRAAKRRQQKLAERAARKGQRKAPGSGQSSSQQDLIIQQSLDLAVRHHNAGDLPAAEKLYRQILKSDPDQPVALHLLGVIAMQVGRHDVAEETIKKAIAIKPDYAEAHNNLGAALKGQRRLADAVASYESAIRIDPGFANAHYNLANVLKDLGRADDSLEPYRKAISINPEYADAHSNLGLALQSLGRADEARSHYQTAIRIEPGSATAQTNLGNALMDLGKLDEAALHHRKAIEIDPDFAEGHYNLGNSLKDLGQVDTAIAHYRTALKIRPDYADARSNLLLTLHYLDCLAGDLFTEHTAWNDHHAKVPTSTTAGPDTSRDPDRPLHVGFVSGDLRKHSVSYFLRPLFSAYDRDRLTFTCYSNARPHHEDEVSAELGELVDGWRHIAHLDDRAVAEQVRADRVDILVDLSGHTKGNRLGVFARKPAPVQATWLGYPDTSGLSAVDYRIVDDVTDPKGVADSLSVERLIRLPEGFLCYAPLADAPAVAPSPGESRDHIVFASFNNLSKLSPDVVAAWARILDAVPESELMLKGRSFSCEAVRRHYLSLFEAHAIEPDRLNLLERSPSTQDHLALYGRADIALDTFPYNGTTTTCEALWMGVPVVAMRGDRHSARVGASILTQVGLSDLVTDDVKSYIDTAVALATDGDRLDGLRMNMRSRMQASPLLDATAFAGNMQQAFEDMWREGAGG